MAANPQGFGYPSRGESPPANKGTGATTGFDYFSRGEAYPAAVPAAGVTQTAVSGTDALTFAEATETLDEASLLADLLDIIFDTSRSMTDAEVLATLADLGALASVIASPDSWALADAGALGSAVTGPDSAAASDSGAVASVATGADPATAADSGALAAALPDADSATLAEASTLTTAVAGVAPAPSAATTPSRYVPSAYNRRRPQAVAGEFATTLDWEVWDVTETVLVVWWRVLEPVVAKDAPSLGWVCLEKTATASPLAWDTTEVLLRKDLGWDALEPELRELAATWDVLAPVAKSERPLEWGSHNDLDTLMALGVL